MKPCNAEMCATCQFIEGKADCLRHKARYCLWLASHSKAAAVRNFLMEMSIDLTQEADIAERGGAMHVV